MKVLQFGEGNFLRSFVDLYFDTLNKEDVGKFEVVLVKPIKFGNIDKFHLQDCKYHVVLRGSENKKDVENVFHVDCVSDIIDPYSQNEYFFDTAKDADIKIIVSNTTEAGICFNKDDNISDFDNITYPAKLTRWLLTRYYAKLPGVYLLPVELIENNADELLRCVLEYVALWGLPGEFKNWIINENYFCNTLVDRIVSGYPRDEETKEHVLQLIGTKDELFSIAEPFGLWVIQEKGNIKQLLKDGRHNIEVIFTPDISYYKKRKVRVLNGSHTNLVPIALWYGKETVFDVMKDVKLSNFVENTLTNDIIPFVSDDIQATTKFANDVKERFLNPFLNHQLTSIALNAISKWKARDLCSFVDYYNVKKEIPRYLTIGFAYLINMYQHIEKIDDKFVCHLPNRDIEVKDDLKYLEYFVKNNVHDFISDNDIWGMDLSQFNNFESALNQYLSMIKQGKCIL